MYTEVETECYTHKTYNVINRYDLSLKKNHKQPKNEGGKGYTCRPRKKKIKNACPLFWTYPEFMHLVLSSPHFTLMTPITPLCV